MLRVDLGRLGREDSILVEARVPSDDGLWQESDLAWQGDVNIGLSAATAGTGEIIVRGTVVGVLDQECRRCLRPVATDFVEDVTLVFVSDPGEEGGQGDAYAFDAGRPELDLSEAVREELILSINPYVVCDPECEGLCAKCGTNRSEVGCDCVEDETDPRWEALRTLQDK